MLNNDLTEGMVGGLGAHPSHLTWDGRGEEKANIMSVFSHTSMK